MPSGAPRPGRLKRRAEFLRVAAKGRKAAVRGLVLQALATGDDAPARLGFTVTKKVGNAVVRNRTRRRLKEAARLELAERPLTGLDLVMIGRAATRAVPFAELRHDLRRALRAAAVPANPQAPPQASIQGTTQQRPARTSREKLPANPERNPA